MSDGSTRRAWLYGVAGLVLGILVSGGFRAVSGWTWRAFRIGLPELAFVFGPILFLTFWVVLIVAIVRGLGLIGRARRDRLEDLPADFDDWHRRAHAQMTREAAAADHSGSRG